MTQHHDPVHPDSPHLSVELVADLAGGLLDDDSAAHAQHHLDQCAVCAQIPVALGQVSGALRGLPAVTMPSDTVARLDAALAAAPTPVAATPVADTVVPLDAHRRRAGWSTRVVTAAASVAGILLVTAVGVSLVSNGSGSDSTAAGADAAGGAGAEAGPTAPALDRYVTARSGRSYDEKRLVEQVDTLLVSSQTTATPSASPSQTDSSPDAPDPMVTARVNGSPTVFPAAMVDPLVLRACVVDYLLRPDAAPLAADVGTYEGQPAAVLVMPKVDDADKAEVFVVDPDCSGPDATLLLYLVVSVPAELRP